MEKSKKLRVSWPSDYLLCQVKMFVKDDCPAKVSCSNKPKGVMNLVPPGFERTQYASSSSRIKNKVISYIPRIKWKKPLKFIINDGLLVKSGEESKEKRNEDYRNDKVLEAFYPHRSLIPNRPSVSLEVENERYDDSKTPKIRLTPIEDEPVATTTVLELPSPTKEVLPPGLEPELSKAVIALMKTKEHGSNIDAELLIKFLSDPNIVKSLLMNGTEGKPLETATNTPTANISTKPSLVTSSSSAMDIRNPSPKPIAFPRNVVPTSVQSSVFVATTEQPPIQAVSSMKPCSVFQTYPVPTGLKKTGISRPNQVDAVSVSVSEQKAAPKPPQPQSFKGTGLPVSVQSSAVSVATSNPPLLKPSALSMKPCSVIHTYPLSTELKNPLPRPRDSYQTALSNPNQVSEEKTVQKPQSQTDSQIRNVAYTVDQVSAKPVKNLDYFKNLIREHGGVVTPPSTTTTTTKETNNYKGRVQNMKKVNNNSKVRKKCIYFGRGRGCKLGESCLFLHDNSKRLWSSDVAPDLPREAKRLKYFGT